MALVVVLSLIVLLSLMVVGLLLTSENERKISARQIQAVDARVAADSAIQIVQGQIRQATIQGIDSNGKGTMAWASQPGALRVFDQSGDEIRIYKLYSSDVMLATGGGALAADMPNDWAARPNEFVDLNEPVKRGNDWIFPIASPSAIAANPASPQGNEVIGFESSLPNTGGPDGPDNRLVMPARWLYLMEDGTLSADPSVGEPIIRFAFWTDDESSKINLNTASATDEGSYWDIPRATFKDDRDLYAWRQPSQNEFHRYPGHPATVNLRTVFPAASVQDIVAATPRYEWGGSKNGQLSILETRTPILNDKDDRLYATPDEFLFTKNRPDGQLSLSAPALDAKRFFLTTSSRSSELNLFGQPRVILWPISGINNQTHRTVYDQAIAFASTLGYGTANAKPYYFLRSDPNSQTADWDLYSRNRQIFAYLQDLTETAIPGFGGNFKTKYDSANGGVAGERDQILTEMFDYIRTVNLNESYDGRPAGFVPYTPELQTNNGTTATYTAGRGAGWVLPIDTPYGRGAGRVPVLAELGLWFIQTYDVHDPPEEGPTPPNSAPLIPEIQPGIVVGTFSPMLGFPPWVPLNFSYRLTNVTPPTVNGHNLIEDFELQSTYLPPGNANARSQEVGGLDGWAWLMTSGMSTQDPNHLGASPNLTSKSDAIPLTPGATTFTITPGRFKIEFLTSPNPKTRGEGTVFQTYYIDIPQMTLPVPTPVDVTTYSGKEVYIPIHQNGWSQRKEASTSPPTFWPEDVVRGIPVKNGDFRTMAYLEEVPSTFFDDSAPSAHGFRDHNNGPRAFLGSTSGKYIKDLSYAIGSLANGVFRDSRPKLNPAINGLEEAGWDADFDNGIGNWVDGPYLNKSDEGILSWQKAANRLPYFFERRDMGEGLFSPSRQVPSAVVFGSLPTSVKRSVANPAPWRTLAFSPNPLSGASHYGLSDPPDFLLLDLFTMPVVEPYVISEPFSTAGRINMNYRMAPYSHITRQTALYAALASQKVIAIADSLAATYKTAAYPDTKIRWSVNPKETLNYFDKYLAAKGQGIFRSASEICGIYLVPDRTTAGVATGVTANTVEAWWNNYRLTGNNSRERPYATLYPLLTTKSNVFTTHIRAQAIKRLPDKDNIPRFAVLSEFRGSTQFERYLDPNDPVFEATGADSVNPDEKSLEPYFKFRTLYSKQFDP